MPFTPVETQRILNLRQVPQMATPVQSSQLSPWTPSSTHIVPHTPIKEANELITTGQLPQDDFVVPNMELATENSTVTTSSQR